MPRFAGAFQATRVQRPPSAPARLVPVTREREPRTSLGALLAPSQVAESCIPGFSGADRLQLNTQARAELEKALARGADPRHLVIHIEPGSARVVNRSELVAEFKKFGVPTAKKIAKAHVPAGCILLLVDADETVLTIVPLARLLDE